MTKEEAKVIFEKNAVPVFPLQIEYQDWLTAMGMVTEALEKQIPKKPINYDSVPHSRCPVCNNSIKVFEDAHEYHYCLYCGQALDWSEEI